MNDILDYYHSMYGIPAREAKFVASDGRVVYIYKWDELQTGEDVAIYATLGANKILGDTKQYCEFFIGIKPEVDSIADALAEIAIYGNGTNQVPSNGDTTTLAYNLWQGTLAKTFMFSNGSELIPSIELDSGKLVTFIQLVPLFDKELMYKKEYGEDGLWEKFEEMGVPYWESTRENSLK